ncbi:MAG: glycine cleavage T C-terminal barrel domain-containing protein, partial [Rhodospirillaceae bacterium]
SMRDDRKQLVGLLPLDPKAVLPEGGQITAMKNVKLPVTDPVPMIGHVTSSYHSPTMDCAFALALVKGGRARLGETVYVPLADRTIAATVTSPVFYDPHGEKLHG